MIIVAKTRKDETLHQRKEPVPAGRHSSVSAYLLLGIFLLLLVYALAFAESDFDTGCSRVFPVYGTEAPDAPAGTRSYS